MPGALPVLNREAVRHVLAVGLAIDARIPEHTRWDRKNYFYPDLPKGYQISQYELPLASAGRLGVEAPDGPVEVGITRAHLEEDTARLVHTRLDGRPVSLIDYDRSGIPLLEIVSDPVIHDARTARRYAEELRLLLADHRGLGRGHGERPDARRGQRLAAAGGQRGLRDPGRGQEHELVPLRRAGHRLRDRAPGSRASGGRAAHPGDARLGRRPRPDLPHAHEGDLGRLPLLPRARPAAAAPRCRLARGDRTVDA